MSVARVKELGETTKDRATPTHALPERGGRRFDPGFADAVKSGLLSPKQALERGRRVAYAAGIFRRHGLSEELCYAVTDNRMSLSAAMRARGAQAPIELNRRVAGGHPHRGAPASSTRSGLFLTGAVAVILIVGSAAWALKARGGLVDRRATSRMIRDAGQQALEYKPAASEFNEHLSQALPSAKPAAVPLALGQVELDESGAPSRVRAGTPKAVMLAYCRIDRACDPTQPIELAPSVPASSGVRIGLFSDDREGKRWAMWILKDRRNRRWVAGDGKGPIRLVPAFEARIGSPRISVDTS